MKTLIVATDFSREAENATEYAGAAAAVLGAKVILFNSFDVPVHLANSLLPASNIAEIMEQNNQFLQERARKLSEDYSIETGYESGLLLDVSKELKNLIAKHEADLVVMGMAASSLAQDIFGNTTTAAIMQLKFPVLAVPADVKYDGIKKILFACEVTRGVHQKVLDQIRNLSLLFNAEVILFHVREKVSEIEESQVRPSAKEIGDGLKGTSYYFKDVDSEEVIKAIKNELQVSGADLLIMVPYRYGFWNSLIQRSKTRMMASKSSVPLLSIPL